MRSETAKSWIGIIGRDGTWNQSFGPKTKFFLVDALVHLALGSTKREAALHSLAVRLYGISEGDDDRHVKGCVGKLLRAIVAELRDAGTIMQDPREISFDELEGVATLAEDNPDRYLSAVAEDRAMKLAEWAKCVTSPTLGPVHWRQTHVRRQTGRTDPIAASPLLCATDESQVWTLVLVGERLLVGAGD